MLEKIIIKNFRSFKNETTIDFAKTNYTILPQNVSENGILKGAIFVGANASGKSNILEAVKVLLDFMFLERDVNQGIFKCLFSSSPQYSIDYYFKIEEERIRYFFEIDDRKHMISETLEVNQQRMMERLGSYAKSYIADRDGISYDESDVDKETLFLRTLYFNTKFAGNIILKKWMEFLSNTVYVNAFEKQIASYGKVNLGLMEYIKNTGTGSINAFFDRYNFEQNVEYSNESHGQNIVIKLPEDEKTIFFRRKGINVPIPFTEESMGNQNLLRMLPSFLRVIENGGLLLIDEFSSGFHNELETLLVRLFMENAENGQMIFVSHSTNLLSNSLLRPDQEYSVEFHGAEGSSLKRFSTEQPRSAQNVEKMYVSGVFGGLPDYKDEIYGDS